MKEKNLLIEGLHFQPWIGKNYASNNQKILLCGESHYAENIYGKDEDSNDLTTGVIENVIQKETMKTRFFSNVKKIFNNKDSEKFWNNVAYANLIQRLLRNAKEQPSESDIVTIKLSFNLLINTLKPEKVIVLSKRMWEYWMPDKGWEKEKKTSIKEKKYSTEVWKYNYENRHCLVIGTYHPSSRYFSSKNYFPLINKFLSM